MALFFVRNVTRPATAAPSVSPHGYVVDPPNGNPAQGYAALGVNFPVQPGDVIEAVPVSSFQTYNAAGTIVFSQVANPNPPAVGT